MGTSAVSLRLPARVRSPAMARLAVPGGLGLLVALSVLLRTQYMDVGFWVDEALSVGVADRPFTAIPDALRLDGSPPLYYLLLHGWLRLLGSRTEEATHALSLLFSVLAVLTAFGLVRSLAGARAGWVAAVLFAVNPFLTAYAQETRMYALVVLLGTVTCACFAGAFVQDRGARWTAGFAAGLTGLLYTHNWSLFLVAALGITWIVLLRGAGGEGTRRALFRRGVAGFGIPAVLYLPWLPALIFQAQHTGAPWARVPGVENLTTAPGFVFGQPGLAALVVAGMIALPHLRGTERGRLAATMLGLALGALVIAWLASQASPAWANRYLAMMVAPLVLAAALVLERAGRAFLPALVLVVFLCAGTTPPDVKSNVRDVASAVAPSLRAGDLVVSTQPEQAPAVAYYLAEVEGLRYATLFGALSDLGVTDWRDGVQRLEASRPERNLAPLLDDLPPGGRLVLIEPEIYNLRRWSAPWTRLVRVRSAEWRAWMMGDPRFRVVATRPETFDPPAPNPVRATVFLKSGMG